MRRKDGVYVADTARILGDVTIGSGTSVWYGVTIRGDVAPVTIGRGSNVQENAVIHCDHGEANAIGDDVTIGHGAIVHGMLVDDGSLIGMGAVLLGRSRIGKRCLIAAGAVIAPGVEIPDESVVMGMPGKVVRRATDDDLAALKAAAASYRTLSKRHHEHPDDPAVKAWNGGEGNDE